METFDKKSLSERDICTKFITPALLNAKWDLQSQIREEVFITKGQVIVRGRLVSREKGKRADYILYHKPNIPIAVIEAKDNNHSIGDGMQQALTYAEMLDVPLSFSSNGDAFLEHDRSIKSGPVEREFPLESFPSHADLWNRYCNWKEIQDADHSVITQDYYSDISGKETRYYQAVAINRSIEAIATGKNRILLVMATGTGKTFTAFQIIHRLWKSRTKKRILFLVDRNILADQTKINDFKPFGKAMTKIKNRKVDKAFEIYLALYQAVTGPEEEKKIFKEFSPDFFDLIVIDECHRGSAEEDSQWREILEYFSSATQIGMTATPKETKYVSNINYFGEPVYTYSLKQGIEDGFLAPYKVIRIDLDKDLTGWRPEKDQLDKYGKKIEDREYNKNDFDRELVLEKRTELVAEKVSDFLKATNRFDKTIVFCEDIDHAGRMRQALVNENSDLTAENRRYVMKITGDDNEGKAELDNFIHPESKYPVIATTSRLLTAGVDVRTCKLIVLDRVIRSLSEFKQIIGRGTRINEEFNKFFFTIMDFKGATQLFSDPDFDGKPIKIFGPEPREKSDPGDPKGREKYFVEDEPVYVVSERVYYYGKGGQLVTESLKDFTRKTVNQKFSSLDNFIKQWNKAEKKQTIIQELEEQGISFDALQEEVGEDYDAFDLITHIVYDQPPLTRRERAENVRKQNYFSKYGDQVRAVLDALLIKYADEGIKNLEKTDILKIPPIKDFGTPIEIVEKFGGKDKYLQAIQELEDQIYKVA